MLSTNHGYLQSASMTSLLFKIEMYKRAAGPDGLPIDIYKNCKDKLVRAILDMLVEAFEENKLPVSLNEAYCLNQENPTKNVKTFDL